MAYPVRTVLCALACIVSFAGASSAQDPVVSENGRAGTSRTPPRLDLIAVIGQGEDPATLLSQPICFLVDSGEVFVTDEGLKAIQVYGTDGVWRRRIGGEGKGPGEFTGPMGTHLGPDGRLVVFDFFNHRISWFDRTGRFLDSGTNQSKYITTVPLRLNTGEYVMTQDGGMRIFSWDREGNPVAKGLLRVVGPDYETTRWIGTWREDPVRHVTSLLNSVVVARHSGGRVAAAFTYENAIRIFDEEDGRLLRTISRELPFKIRDPGQAGRRAETRGTGGGFQMVDYSDDEVSIAAAFDRPGRLWVMTRILGHEEAEARLDAGQTHGVHHLEVYDPGGNLLATLPFDEGVDALSFGPQGDLWVLDREQDAVIRRYRVVWPTP